MAEKSCSSTSCSKESCEGCPSAKKPQSFLEELNVYSEVKHVIGLSLIHICGTAFDPASFVPAATDTTFHNSARYRSTFLPQPPA